MSILRTATAVTAGAAMLAAAFVAQAQPTDLIGARANRAEQTLRDRGYRLDRNEGRTAFWWDPNRRICITVVTDRGRFTAIDRVDNRRCGGGGSSSRNNAGVAIGAALLIGALAASASSRNQRHAQDRFDDPVRNDPPFSPARDVWCYPDQRACFETGRGFSASWTSNQFGDRN